MFIIKISLIKGGFDFLLHRIEKERKEARPMLLLTTVCALSGYQSKTSNKSVHEDYL